MSSRDSSSSAATETSKKKSKEPRGRSKTKERTASKYELLERSKTKKSSRSNSTANMSTAAMKKSKGFLVKYGKLLVVALFLVLPLTLLLCLATNSVQSDNTWLGFVAHLYISTTCVLITLGAFLLKALLLLPLYLAFFTINFLLWLFNCNETVVDQIVTTAAVDPYPYQVQL